MDRDQAGLILAQLYTVWKSEETEDQLENEVTIWAWAFADEPVELVQYGIELWIRGGKPFMPKPADIRLLLAKRQIQLQPDEQWAEIRRVMRTWGIDRKSQRYFPDVNGGNNGTYLEAPKFPEAVERVIKSVGWVTMCQMSTDDCRRTFLKALDNVIENEIECLAFGDKPFAKDLIIERGSETHQLSSTRTIQTDN